jgi:hypothetical protein
MRLNTSKLLWVFIRTTKSNFRKVHFFLYTLRILYNHLSSQALYRYKVLTA